MRLEKCVNGHFYDAETYSHCPHCNKIQAVTAIPSRFQKLGYITFLGSGSTSQVYKITGEQEYALKIVECGDNGPRYLNTLYELRIMEKLRGESHAVQLCDYEIVDEGQCKTVFILEKYYHTLSEYLSSKQFRIADLLQLAIGVCDSLIACREFGILHLDVQPKNVFVDHLFHIKLGDFSHSLFAYDVKTNRISVTPL